MKKPEKIWKGSYLNLHARGTDRKAASIDAPVFCKCFDEGFHQSLQPGSSHESYVITKYRMPRCRGFFEMQARFRVLHGLLAHQQPSASFHFLFCARWRQVALRSQCSNLCPRRPQPQLTTRTARQLPESKREAAPVIGKRRDSYTHQSLLLVGAIEKLSCWHLEHTVLELVHLSTAVCIRNKPTRKQCFLPLVVEN